MQSTFVFTTPERVNSISVFNIYSMVRASFFQKFNLSTVTDRQ